MFSTVPTISNFGQNETVTHSENFLAAHTVSLLPASVMTNLPLASLPPPVSPLNASACCVLLIRGVRALVRATVNHLGAEFPVVKLASRSLLSPVCLQF